MKNHCWLWFVLVWGVELDCEFGRCAWGRGGGAVGDAYVHCTSIDRSVVTLCCVIVRNTSRNVNVLFYVSQVSSGVASVVL